MIGIRKAKMNDRFSGFMQWGHGAGFGIYFIVLWCGICYVLSLIGGWHTLAQRYRFEGRFEGERWHFRQGVMRWNTRYGGALTLGSNQVGLYVAILFPFRLGHPPLFIPWSEITIRQRRWWLMQQTGFILGKEAQIPLWVYARLGQQILQYRPPQGGVMQDMYSRPGLDDPRPIV